jgi:glucuronosyltransferase
MNHKGFMNFRQRLRNFLENFFNIGFDYFNNRWQRQLYDKYFPVDRYISYDKMLQNISLVFVNSYFSQEQVRPLVPGMIEIGGIQIKKPSKLPEVSEK